MHAEITYLLDLLGAFVRQQSAKPLPPDIHMPTLLQLAQDSNLSGVVGYMLLPQSDALGEYAAPCNKLFFKTVGLFANRQDACRRLQQQLANAAIEHAFIKGAVLSQLYPAKELRTFSDIDVYVAPHELPRLKQLLAENGDTISHEDATQICISRPPLFVEFHFSLTVEEAPSLDAYLGQTQAHIRFADTMGMHTVTPIYHFIYLLAHQLHHFSTDSPGIRSYLDLAVLLKSGLLSDADTLTAALKEVGLYDYARTALSLCEHWFKIPSILPAAPLEQQDVTFLEEYLFHAGQFAHNQNPRTKQVAEQKGKAPRFRAFWRSLFPTAEHMRNEKAYAKLARRCLPLAYIYRLFRGIFCRTSYALSSAKAIAGAAEEAAAHNRILTIVGGNTHEEK